MNRRSFLKRSALGGMGLAAGISSARPTAAANRPNILFCMSDDQSWVHTSIAGDPVIKTPNFDRVAREGLLFTNSYTSCPSCTPSRAAILTGQDFWRLEEGGLLFGRLKKKFPLYTRLLEDAGYVVGQTGKGYEPAYQEFDNTWQSPCGTRWEKEIEREGEEEEEEEEEGIGLADYSGAFQDFMNARDRSRPFCFWYGGFEPHREYAYGSGAESGMEVENVNVPPFLPDCEDIRHDIADYLHEIEWFDKHLGRMIKTLEDHGELDNTLIVVTSDNGMPFPRAKSTLYNYGVRMPLAIRWGSGIKKTGRVVDDMVNHIDFAPSFLEAAGVPVPEDMTGRSLMNIFASESAGVVEPERSSTVVGLERHVWARPDGKTYPRRAIYTQRYSYIRNYEPGRWPMGGPDFGASHVDIFGDIDAGPTKTYMMEHQDEPDVRGLFAKSFGKLPAEELYAIDEDPAQMTNLADDPKYRNIKEKLRKQMEVYQRRTKDPRVNGESPWDDYPYYADKRYLRGEYLEEVEALELWP